MILIPEFDRKVLEVLREPMESGFIVIARAKDRMRFPARFQLVAAMNPCPCTVDMPGMGRHSTHSLPMDGLAAGTDGFSRKNLFYQI